MMALLLARVTRWLIEHHVYSFNDEMFHQTDGAPIGLQIAVNISRLVMIDWDQQMMVLMINNNLKVELMMRYVDDVNIILRFQHHNKENNILEKEVAAKITQIADSVFTGVLVFESDLGLNHENGKLPILDLECWVNEAGLVMFSFYKKKVNNDAILGPKSGFAPTVLRNILLQEYLRRMMNCSKELDDSIRFNHLSRINLDMMNAGHSESFRANITNRAIEIYKERLTKPKLYRSKSEVVQNKTDINDQNWFKMNGEFDAVFNVPPTVDQELLNTIRNCIKDLPMVPGTKVKLQQAYGRTGLDNIMTRDIGSNKLCSRPKCMICRYPGSSGGCKKEGITYQMSCTRSPCAKLNPNKPLDIPSPKNEELPAALYRGETSRTGFIRSSRHQYDYSKKDQKSVLWKHAVLCHEGVLGPDKGTQDFQMTKLRQWTKPLQRLTDEALLIKELEDMEEVGEAVCLNSKEDFMQSHKVTLTFGSGNCKER